MKFDASTHTFQGYIILEWVGRWIVPDTNHGGAPSKLFRLESDARKALVNYLDKQWRREDYAQEDLAYYERERAIAEERHCIVPISWPLTGPNGEECAP